MVKPVATGRPFLAPGGLEFLDLVLGLFPDDGLSFLCHADFEPSTSPGLSEL